MVTRKSICFALIFYISTIIIALPLSYAKLPKNYQEKKVFYDSLSIVINKYIVPVGNWGLFEGTLQGIQSYIGEDQFALKSENNLINVSIKNRPLLRFSKEDIDTNAIELIESISTVFDSIFEQFTNLDKIRIINAAIAGMVATLEPNSYFIEPEDLERLQAQNRGVFEGIGLEITSKDGIITVVSPYQGTPAFRQGLQPNDKIMAVDGITTKGLRIMEVSEKIRGERGKPVTLTIERRGWESPKDIILIRDTISHRTIKSFQLEPGFGYVRIINFLGTTGKDFASALNNLAKTSQLEGLILDLRYNPGGLLNQSLGVADFFLNNGIIATTDGRVKSDNKTYYARLGTEEQDYPIVIIINEGSASGTEIVASALRTHHRAVLVGERSFGKGFMQAIFPVKTGGAIRLTTSMLLTPDGKKIQNVGIAPDLDINPSLLDYEKPSTDDPTVLPIMESGATKDDPVVQISLDILKRSLLLQDTPEEELEGLSKEQAALIKRFNGLSRAVGEVTLQKKLQNF
jgi:carboxyl-terminal processing protease